MYHVPDIFLYVYCFCCVCIECLIPDLHVQKVDTKLIEQKRQDTLDLCRMFTEENERLERFNNGNDVTNHNFLDTHRRVKRDLKTINSSLDLVEAKRVENIVDKLYDDMAEHGERVTYRQWNLSTVKTPLNVQNQTARRFNFVPAMLSHLLSSTSQPMLYTEMSNNDIPWLKSWKNGIVPYFIDSNTYDPHLSDIIISAFDYFEKATCIRLQRLRERPTDKESLQNVEWLYITNPSGIRQCVHSNERKPNRGVQMVVFGYDCLSIGEVLHEIMHILGFSHEHTRPDRDQYITVVWDNIKPGYKKYFEIRTADALSNLPYDYASVLHYPSRAFSKNGQVTLLLQSGIKVGQREGLSDTDIAKVSTVYSAECTKRNKEYLLSTCPSVVKPNRAIIKNVTQKEIENYFEDRIWPYGIINYKIRDKMEFSAEERENIDAVIRHIEKETCIEFRDTSMYDVNENENDDDEQEHTHIQMSLDEDAVSDANPNETNNKDFLEINNEITEDSKENDSSINGIDVKDEEEVDNSTVTNYLSDSDLELIDLRKNIGSKIVAAKGLNKTVKSTSKSSFAFGSLFKGPSVQRQRSSHATTAGRRHAESTLTLVRSPEPGCRCPPPGRPKGDQVLKINTDCFNSVNDLLHLFVHILGLDHQHNMHDRDSYLHILWNNLAAEILQEMKNKLPPAASIGFPYDYQSVMHYPWLHIKNGVTNIMYPTWNDGWAMGHWQGLSSTDVNKLNLIYSEQCSLRRLHTQK